MPHLGELQSLVFEMNKSFVPAVEYDYVDATTSYYGEAAPGTATSAASWRIKLITIAGDDVTITWADGNSAFDNVWDDRASMSYS